MPSTRSSLAGKAARAGVRGNACEIGRNSVGSLRCWRGPCLILDRKPDDTVTRLEKAKAMLDKGLISDAEFEALKARIVNTL